MTSWREGFKTFIHLFIWEIYQREILHVLACSQISTTDRAGPDCLNPGPRSFSCLLWGRAGGTVPSSVDTLVVSHSPCPSVQYLAHKPFSLLKLLNWPVSKLMSQLKLFFQKDFIPSPWYFVVVWRLILFLSWAKGAQRVGPALPWVCLYGWICLPELNIWIHRLSEAGGSAPRGCAWSNQWKTWDSRGWVDGSSFLPGCCNWATFLQRSDTRWHISPPWVSGRVALGLQSAQWTLSHSHHGT